MRPIPKPAVKLNLFVSLIFMFLTFTILFARFSPVMAFASAAAVGCCVFGILMEKYLRRYLNSLKPFPDDWRKILESRVAFYRKLDDSGRRRFETDVRVFLHQQRIFGLRGGAVAEDVKLMIAASAATLGFGLPDWEWPDLRDILVFPTGFDQDYRIRKHNPFKGMVHQQGPIIFSEDELQMGFLKSGSDTHVGLHEMAHVLDMANGSADGVPIGMDWVATAPWVRIMADRIQKVRQGECREILRDYAGVDEAEFFAVAVEVFFQKPGEMKAADPELFRLLAEYFNVDPQNPSAAAG